MKLNLGCGNDYREDYMNIDNRVDVKTDVFFDISKPFDFLTDKVDEIFAIDVLEHFSWRLTDKIFGQWIDVLRTGGIIRVVVPNILVHIEQYVKGVKDWKEPSRYDGAWGYFVANIFGGQDYEGNTHYTTFCPEAVVNLFDRHNLDIVSLDLEDRAIIAVGRKK